MKTAEHRALVEALLFLKEEPVRPEKLAAALEITPEEVRSLVCLLYTSRCV